MKASIHIVLFIISFVFMALEIINAKIISPHFGDTVYTWSIIISIFLIGSSVGYIIGGKTSDGKNDKKWNQIYLLSSILGVSFIPVLSLIVFSILKSLGNTNVATFMASLLLFVIPTIAVSAMIPSITKMGYEENLTGKKIGSYHTSSAIGSVLGTLITTFYILPNFGITLSVSILVFLLVSVCIFILGVNYKMPIYYFIPLYLFCLFPFLSNEDGGVDEKIIHKEQSAYHTLYVTETGNVRYLRFGMSDGAIQGALNMKDKNEVILPYQENVLKIIDTYSTKPRYAFMIGHGTGTITSELEKRKMEIEVAEIDKDVLKLSEKYFYYKGNSVKIGDGRRILNQKKTSSLDIIVLDAFNGSKVPGHMVTEEFYKEAESKLNKNGIVVMNFIGSLNDNRVLSVFTTMRSVFPEVKVLKKKGTDAKKRQNLYFVASMKKMNSSVEGMEEIDIKGKGEIITDEKQQMK